MSQASHAELVSTDAAEILKQSLHSAVEQIVQSLEPQIQEFATKAAGEVIDRAGVWAQSGLKTVQRQPWYLVGAAATLLVGAAIVLGFNGTNEDDRIRRMKRDADNDLETQPIVTH